MKLKKKTYPIHIWLWISAGVRFVLSLIDLLIGVRFNYYTAIIFLSCAALVYLGFVIRDKKSGLPETIGVCALLLFEQSFASIAFVVLYFLRKSKIGAKLPQMLWIVPCALSGLSFVPSVVNFFRYSMLMPLFIFTAIISFAFTFRQYLELGRWVFDAETKSANKKANAEANRRIAYYTELFEQGVITAEELEAKKNEILQ